ncbi:MAG: preprotein translocase subunit YajC [Acidocella sp.]|nr:preprotein translocase subunit YajC [Acidocella sp.]
MFITPAYAQTLSGGATSLTSLAQFAPLVLIFVVFYFLLIRPTQVQQKKLKARLAMLKRGDKIVTAGGIVGVVKKAGDGATEIEVEIAPSVVVNVVRSTVTSFITPEPANDKI